MQDKTRKIIGFCFGIAGLVLLIWNAYVYLSHQETSKVSVMTGLLFCIEGAVLIKKSKSNAGQ